MASKTDYDRSIKKSAVRKNVGTPQKKAMDAHILQGYASAQQDTGRSRVNKPGYFASEGTSDVRLQANRLLGAKGVAMVERANTGKSGQKAAAIALERAAIRARDAAASPNHRGRSAQNPDRYGPGGNVTPSGAAGRAIINRAQRMPAPTKPAPRPASKKK